MVTGKDPFKLPGGGRTYDTLKDVDRKFSEQPYTRYTQGGSSRKNSGARVAAVDASLRPIKKDKWRG